jgi:protein-S-isoprenylcysteine O-methyltransferase Ste14
MSGVNWPVLIIGLVMAFYWGRVLKLVRKARKRTGRGANFIPREPLGRMLRVIWFPVVGIWIAHPLISGLGVWPIAALRPVYRLPSLQWICAGVAVAALGGTMVCWRRMGTSWRMGIDPEEKTSLVVMGPYAYVRHPIYALSSLLMLATVIALPSPVMIAAAAVHLVFLQWEARREEIFLVDLHGLAYSNYAQCVGRFFPRSLRAYQDAGKVN